MRHLRMPTCAARASYRTRDEFSLNEFSTSSGNRASGLSAAPGVGNRRDEIIEEQSASFWQKCVFFFHANEQNKNVTPNS